MISGTRFAGARIPHTGCSIERFNSGLDGYSIISGNSTPFVYVETQFGGGVHIDPWNGMSIARIQKPIQARLLREIKFKFRVEQINTDDAGAFSLFSGTDYAFSFNAMREGAFDGLRRAIVFIGGATQPVTSVSLNSGEWYQFELTIEAGGVDVLITRMSDDFLVGTATFVGSYMAVEVDQIGFVADTGGLTTETEFADIEVCGLMT